MLFQDTLQRLRDRVTGMRLIDGVSSLAEAMRGARVVPALYLVPLADKAIELGHFGGATDQRITTTFGVILALDAGRTAMGLDAVLALEAARAQVRAALVGWVPEPANGESVTFAGGELLDLPADARLWWADDFEVTSYYRSTP